MGWCHRHAHVASRLSHEWRLHRLGTGPACATLQNSAVLLKEGARHPSGLYSRLLPASCKSLLGGQARGFSSSWAGEVPKEAPDTTASLHRTAPPQPSLWPPHRGTSNKCLGKANNLGFFRSGSQLKFCCHKCKRHQQLLFISVLSKGHTNYSHSQGSRRQWMSHTSSRGSCTIVSGVCLLPSVLSSV